MDEIKKFKTFEITFMSGVESTSIITLILRTEEGSILPSVSTAT